MKKRIFPALALLCLILGGCGEENALSDVRPELPAVTAGAPTVLPTMAPRDLHVTLTMMAEGEPYPVAATLYEGSDYSIYIPDSDWLPEGEDLWVFARNPEASMWILDYSRFGSQEAAVKALEENGYAEESPGYLVLREDGVRNEIVLLRAGDRLRGFCYCFPDSTEFTEGMYAVMPMILDTFLWE